MNVIPAILHDVFSWTPAQRRRAGLVIFAANIVLFMILEAWGIFFPVVIGVALLGIVVYTLFLGVRDGLLAMAGNIIVVSLWLTLFTGSLAPEQVERAPLAVGLALVAALIGGSFGDYERRLRDERDQVAHVMQERDEALISLKHTLIELEQTRDEALAASRLKSQILSNMSHDARTPLNAISLYAEMVREGMYGNITNEQRDAMDGILQAAQTLASFFTNVLDLSQLSSNAVKLESQPFALKSVLDSASFAMRPAAEAKDLIWREAISADAPQKIVGDAARVRQIFFNLMDNAVKFTRNGEINIRVEGFDDRRWAIVVQDTGIGIEPAHIDDIFEAFWQVDGSSTREVMTGVGLGLSIVKHLCDMMGGEIRVQSTPGVGSTFTVILPNSMAANTQPAVALPLKDTGSLTM